MEETEEFDEENVTGRSSNRQFQITSRSTSTPANIQHQQKQEPRQQQKQQSEHFGKMKSIMSAFSLFASPGRERSTKLTTRTMNEEDDNSEHEYDDDGEDDASIYLAPTKLHRACFSASSFDNLRDRIKSSYSSDLQIFTDLQRKDRNGCNPLHLLGLNKKLAFSTSDSNENERISDETDEYNVTLNKKKAAPIADFCLDVLPLKILPILLDQNEQGRIPFEETLIQWIDDLHLDPVELERNKKGSLARKSKEGEGDNLISPSNVEQQDPPLSSDSSSIATSFFYCCGHYKYSHQNINQVQASTKQPTSNIATEELSRHFIFPSTVRLTIHIEYVLYLLSAILDYLDEAIKAENNRITAPHTGRKTRQNSSISLISSPLSSSRSIYDDNHNILLGNSGILHTSRMKDPFSFNESDDLEEGNTHTSPEVVNFFEIRSKLLMRIASIPDLMKTLLLLVDDLGGERERIFEYSMVRRVMLQKESVGKWLTSMLQTPRRMRLAERAVDYFELLSEVSKKEAKVLQQGNSKETKDGMEDFYEKLCYLDLIPSMLALDQKMVEKASTTRVIARVLDKMITSPFSIILIFWDVVSLILLIFSFRRSVDGFLLGHNAENVIHWIYATNWFTFYFVLKEIGKIVALWAITSKRVFFRNLASNVWNMVDIVCVLITLLSTILMRIKLNEFELDDVGAHLLQKLLSITTLLLWLKFLGLIKTINMQLATFVLAIIEITKDIKWYLMIIGTFVLSFSQVFYTLLIPQECRTNESVEESCKSSEYYQKIYTVILGDTGLFEIQDFPTFGLVMLVFCTFLVVIILLNVLIAIIGDSYEKCMIRSKTLFGRARVLLLAELVSFQNFFIGDKNTEALRSTQKRRWIRWSRGAFTFTFLATISILIWIVGEYILYREQEDQYGNYYLSLASILANVGLLTVFLIMLSSNRTLFGSCSIIPIRIIMLRLLGMSADPEIKDSEIGEWKGRVLYLRKEMSQVMDETSKRTHALIESELTNSNTRTKRKINSLEKKMYQSEQRILAELQASEDRMKKMLQEFMETARSH